MRESRYDYVLGHITKMAASQVPLKTFFGTKANDLWSWHGSIKDVGASKFARMMILG